MSNGDTEKFRIAHNMDDLMIRTIGLIESIPARLLKLETSVQEIEKEFSRHCGEQEQGIKRTVDRVDTLKEEVKALSKKFEGCSVGDDLRKIEETISEIERDVKDLMTDLTERKETQKTIIQYAKEAFTSFIRYAMLPITIIVLVLFGMDPSYIPWYKEPKPDPVVTTTKNISEALWDKVYMDSITERDVVVLQNQFPKDIITVTNPDYIAAEREYRSRLVRTNIISRTHIFVWIPSSGKEGLIQVFDSHGRKIGNVVRIARGI